MIVLGDVLFRQYLVLFDLTSLIRPTIGIAKQNPEYKFGTWHPTIKKLRAIRRATLTTLVPKKAIDKVTIFNKHSTQYFINITLGTPEQTKTVTFDTGSSMFGVFCKAPRGYTRRAIFGSGSAKKGGSKARLSDAASHVKANAHTNAAGRTDSESRRLAEAAKMAKIASGVTR